MSLSFGSKSASWDNNTNTHIKLTDCTTLNSKQRYLHRCSSVGGELEYINTCIPEYPTSVIDKGVGMGSYVYQPCYHIGQKVYVENEATGRVDTLTCQYEAVDDWRCAVTHDDNVKNAAEERGFVFEDLINMGRGCMGDCKPNQVCIEGDVVKICQNGVWDDLTTTSFSCCTPSASDPELGVATRGCWVPDSTPRQCTDSQSAELRTCVPDTDKGVSYTCLSQHTHQCLSPPCWVLGDYWRDLEDCGQIMRQKRHVPWHKRICCSGRTRAPLIAKENRV